MNPRDAYRKGWNASARTTTYDLDAALDRFEKRYEVKNGTPAYSAYIDGWNDRAADSPYNPPTEEEPTMTEPATVTSEYGTIRVPSADVAEKIANAYPGAVDTPSAPRCDSTVQQHWDGEDVVKRCTLAAGHYPHTAHQNDDADVVAEYGVAYCWHDPIRHHKSAVDARHNARPFIFLIDDEVMAGNVVDFVAAYEHAHYNGASVELPVRTTGALPHDVVNVEMRNAPADDENDTIRGAVTIWFADGLAESADYIIYGSA